ncbi:hypothetical protein [Pseudomonas tohonis]|uniref:hypothetical protein n=1 Tax=Pseudomonas tohonis TaxID=2725477 RepID=UPI001F38C516|nr:hypothetical protein [Pseudomonas tohonis]
MKPTTEELALQILATCMLINAQDVYLATFNYACIDNLWVTVEPLHGLDVDEDAHRYSAVLNDAGAPDFDYSPAEGMGTLTGMLSQLQDYLQKEAIPCAA